MIIDNVIKLLRWCEAKMLLSERQSIVLFKEGEIWWCGVGMNVGKEIYGKGENFIRPILIFKKFNENMFLGIPLTSKRKEGSWYVLISYGDKEGRVILDQIKSMDKKRLVKRIGTLDEEAFNKVQDAFWTFYHAP
jgi:mRNA-degrading endonuclease toxin of MazEF toxin-antitoxin module